MSKTHWKNLANINYLGAYSFDNANEITVTIKTVSSEQVTNPVGEVETCIVATFEEEEVNGVVVKPLILNKTNCQRLEKLYSPYIEDWAGKRITIFKTLTNFGRDKVDCLRIKDEVPFAKAAPQKKYSCSICGGLISEKIYNASMEKFGVAVCSKECAEKIKKEENNTEEGNN